MAIGGVGNVVIFICH